MRLLVRVKAVNSWLRARDKPLLANSCVATSMVLSTVAAGSLMREVWVLGFDFAVAADAAFWSCQGHDKAV